MRQIATDKGTLQIAGYPDLCVYCHNTITPNSIYGHLDDDNLEVYLVCPNLACLRSFIGYYKRSGNIYEFQGKCSIGMLKGIKFSSTIKNVSLAFCEIYNQAYTAEQQNLLEICGVGYRKALEFLIKDYLIQNKPIEKEKIEKKLLGSCITDYIEDKRIKSVAKRAVWLGNDETHYIKKWEGKDLTDLKKLIELTIHWIEMEQLTKSFEEEMPE